MLAGMLPASHIPNTDLKFHIPSFEITEINGQLLFTADIDFLTSRAFQYEMAFTVNDKKAAFKATTLRKEKLAGKYKAKDHLKMTLALSYDPDEIPYHPQVMQVGLRNLETGKMEYGNEIYVYFTPWNTVEIWNSEDFRRLPRAWEASNTSAKRRKVNRNNLPVSDLSAEEWLDQDVPKRYISVPGLAYTIPFKAEPHSSNRGTNTYTGIVNGALTATVTQPLIYAGETDIALSGILVELYSIDPLGDEMIGDAFTENDGSFSIAFSETKAVNPMEVYLKVLTVTNDDEIDVRIGPNGLDMMRDTPLVFQPNVFADQDFGTLLVPTDMIKPQLAHWANLARKFVVEQLASNPGFSEAQLEPLVITRFLTSPNQSFFTPNPFGKILALEPCSHKDYIWIGQNSDLNENTMYHEYGHYLMWQLQNDTWSNVITSGLANHSLRFNDKNPQLAWNEGFAAGFSMILDAYYWEIDGEFNAEPYGSGSSNHESRLLGLNPSVTPEDGRFDIIYPSGTPPVLDGQTITHGYAAEWSIGAAIFDLWDGPTNIEVMARPNGEYPISTISDDAAIPNSDKNFDKFDHIEMSFSEIVQPIIDHQGTETEWLFNDSLWPCELWPLTLDIVYPPLWLVLKPGHPQYLINSVVEYFESLRDLQLSAADKGFLARIFDHNGIYNVDTVLEIGNPLYTIDKDYVNTDLLSFSKTVEFLIFSSLQDTLIFTDGSTYTEDFTVSIHELRGSHDSYNFTPVSSGTSETLTDDLSVNNANLFVNAAWEDGWISSSNHFSKPSFGILPPANTNLDLVMDGGMTLEISNGGVFELGDLNQVQTADVTFKAGSSLILNAKSTSMGADLIVHENCHVVIEPGANFEVHPGANIELEGLNSTLEIRGNFTLVDHTVFTFSGDGRVIFGLPDHGGEYNIDCDENSAILLTGGADSRIRFEIEDGTYVKLDDSKTTKTRLLGCIGYMGEGSYWNLGNSEWTASTLETYGKKPGALGYIWNGSAHTIDSLILGNMVSGIFAKDTLGTNNSLDITRLYMGDMGTGITSEADVNIMGGAATYCSFAGVAMNNAMLKMEHYEMDNSKYGVFSVEGGVELDSVFFSLIDYGWQAIDMNQASKLIQVVATNCDSTGINVLGSGATLTMDSCNLNSNEIGIAGSGPFTIEAYCSKVNNNGHIGLRIADEAILDISTKANNNFSMNATSIFLVSAGIPELNDGENFLNPFQPTGFALKGTIWDPTNTCACTVTPPLCQPVLSSPDLQANLNKWSNAGWGAGSGIFNVRSTDTGCSYNVVDNNTTSFTLACTTPVHKMGIDETSALARQGRILNSGPFAGLRLGNAIVQIGQTNEDLLALGHWQSLLSSDVQNPSPSERSLLDIAYRQMHKTFASLLGTEALPMKDIAAHPLAQAHINAIAQHKFNMKPAPKSGTAFRYDLDLALAYKHLGQPKAAMAILDHLASYEEGLPGLRETCSCTAKAKKEYMDEAISLPAYFQKALACVNAQKDVSPSAGGAEEDTENWITAYPVPATGELFVRFDAGISEAVHLDLYSMNGTVLKVYDLPTVPTHRRSDFRIDLDGLSPGIYILKASSGTSLAFKRIEVIR